MNALRDMGKMEFLSVGKAAIKVRNGVSRFVLAGYSDTTALLNKSCPGHAWKLDALE